jgi:Immunoglobulin I-set domain
MKAKVNESQVFDCPVTGIPMPQVVWLRNGELLDMHRYSHVELRDGGRQLIVYNLAVNDAATYRCIATNPAGQDSQDYELEVHGTVT